MMVAPVAAASWTSFSVMPPTPRRTKTIFTSSREVQGEWREMLDALFGARFTLELDDRAACIAAFERHNAEVRRSVPREHLLEWRASDGWAPLCAALGVPVPSEPFPRVNTSEEFLARFNERTAGFRRS